jgi:histidyl-tRNA synthetase
MNEIIRSVKGTRDFYPREMAIRRWLIGKMQGSSNLFGYQEYEGPCIEAVDLYAAKSGEELVKEQSFVFPDRGGDLIALRPELTPTLARMVAAKQNELVFPLRWWSFGPFWRYERPQKGRSREFYQWNVDLIGLSDAQADAEVVAVAANFFKSVGLNPDQVQILVNNRRLMDESLDSIGISAKTRALAFRLIDKIDKLSPAAWDAYALEIGLSDSQLAGLKEILANQSLWEHSDELKTFFQATEWMGVRDYVSYDPQVIRGLDYYTGTVFEGRDTKRKFRAIFGGGHYDNLVADVGGNPLPGVGFAMGDVVIQLLLEAENCIPGTITNASSVLVTVFDEECLKDSYKITATLREAGIPVMTYPEPDKLAKQFKYADKMGIKLAIVAGPDEMAEGMVSLKDLRTREQNTLTINEAILKIKTFLAEG